MPTQRITVAKIAGRATSVVRDRVMLWSATRTVPDGDLWSPEQWPDKCRREIDTFAARLRAEGSVPPTVYFSEHVDMWSMGDLFRNYFPSAGRPCVVCGDQFWLAGYSLPDDGRLAAVLRDSLSRERSQEETWFHTRLTEAVRAWEELVGESILLILRQVLDATVTDENLRLSLLRAPSWAE